MVAGEGNLVHGSNNVVLPLPDNFNFNFDFNKKKEEVPKKDETQQSNNSTDNGNSSASTITPNTTDQSQPNKTETPKITPTQSLSVQNEAIQGVTPAASDPNQTISKNAQAKNTVSNNW